MPKFGWLALQIAIIGFFVWVDWGVSTSGDPRAMPGVATVIGVVIAFILTLCLSEIRDSFIRRPVLRPPPIPGEMAEPVDHRAELGAPARETRELTEPLRRLR